MNFERPVKIDQIDLFIKDRFSSSFMNNAKWEKLIDTITYSIEKTYIRYKLIYSDKIYDTYLYGTSDYKPFFEEPIFYKEVEWIEFPKEYKIQDKKYIHGNLIKGAQKTIFQNINDIEKIINEMGQFLIENNNSCLKLIAYR
ncbi:DUF6678 family protein [Tenacibaculum sp. M341]|uniref:DUF6678 family protein n=1 Tax=Tenacibaculum sp. M341 TaxID=2530339 RepID=UPI0010511EA0|nr:DUF6678 family protein [Tenacibaculum sp. M341]TCI84707.1 hypothetical protein EYW44_19910 [Tenacibaculum sp. M341]